MRLIKNYMNDISLRHELNALTQETFGFDFEGWVTNGYYEGDYIPYSYEEDGKLIANVSANRMEFVQNGKEKFYIQLGTVMTRKEFRNQGHARRLMENVLEEYAGNCDGIYLYGDLDALEFYEKMGFSKGVQYQYRLKDDVKLNIQKKASEQDVVDCFHLVNPTEEFHKIHYKEAVRQSAVNSAFEQKNKYGLQMFYTSGMEQVYYCSKLDCYIVMEEQEHTLCLQSVICREKVSLEDVLALIPGEYSGIILGFTPCTEDAHLFVPQIYDGGEDYRFFYYGEQLKTIETERLYFPELSHA